MILTEKASINYNEIWKLIKSTCTSISSDVLQLIRKSYEKENNPNAKDMFGCMLENVKLAQENNKPVCQSPGLPSIYVRYGDNADISNLRNDFGKALVEATLSGYLRPSMVHPLNRKNSGDNSGFGIPNFEFQYYPGQEYLEIIISFKGCGAELGNIVKVMTPAQLGKNLVGLKKLVLKTVAEAGGKPCPVIGLGIGIGGQIDVAAKLSREAISTRDWRDDNSNRQLNDLEKELLEKINALKIGPAGIGGDTECLAVKIGMASTHTAICPVAINFHCWVARRSGVRIYKDEHQEYLFGGNEKNEYGVPRHSA
jgi:fumarate hydratase subunit alpha